MSRRCISASSGEASAAVLAGGLATGVAADALLGVASARGLGDGTGAAAVAGGTMAGRGCSTLAPVASMPASNFASGGEAEGGGLSAGAFAGGDAVAGGGDGCADGTIAAGAAGGAPPVMFTGAAPYRLTRYTPAMIATATTATAT